MVSYGRQRPQLSGKPLRGVSADNDFDFNASVSPNTAGALALQSFAVRIRSLSNIGVSFLVDHGSDEVLRLQPDLMLRLSLPGKTGPSTISCHVRHRSNAGDAFLYGCEYDWSSTLDPLGVAEDLVGYMLDTDD